MTDSDFMSKVQFSLNYLLKLVSHRGTSDEICFFKVKFSFFRSYMLFGIFKFELGDPFFDGQCSKQQQDASNGMNYSTLVSRA